MRYIETPAVLDAAEGQALEELIFRQEREEDILLLRIHRPALVCGCYQNIYGEIDLPRALSEEVSVVRRITGGGTVYHDRGNVNYTLIAAAENGGADYDRMMEPILTVLHDMGIPARKNRSCDIAVGDIKISGSAEKIADGRILHHGTLLFDSDLRKLHEYLTVRGSYRSKAIASSPWRVGNIRALCRLSYGTDEFLRRLGDGFLSRYGGEKTAPSVELLREASVLAREKYRSFDWTYAKSPAFEKTVSYGGAVLSYTAEKGILTAVKADDPILHADLQRLLASPITPEALGKWFTVLA